MAVDYDARYRKGYAYGKEANELVRVIASTLLPPATRPLEVLSLGEGQGRNVVHLAAHRADAGRGLAHLQGTTRRCRG